MFAYEQKCQAKGQKLKLDNIKEWKIVSLLSLDKKQPILFSTLIAVKLYDIYFLYVYQNLADSLCHISNNFRTSSHDILADSILKTGSFA